MYLSSSVCICMCAQQVGRIHCAVFSDAALFAEVASKAAFWQQNNYYGVDLTCLLQPACEDYFAQARTRIIATPLQEGVQGVWFPCVKQEQHPVVAKWCVALPLSLIKTSAAVELEVLYEQKGFRRPGTRYTELPMLAWHLSQMLAVLHGIPAGLCWHASHSHTCFTAG